MNGLKSDDETEATARVYKQKETIAKAIVAVSSGVLKYTLFCKTSPILKLVKNENIIASVK